MKKIVNLLLAVVMACTMFNFVACNEDKIFKGNYEAASAEQQTEMVSNTANASNEDVYSTDGYLMKVKVVEQEGEEKFEMAYTVKTRITDGKARMSMEMDLNTPGMEIKGDSFYYEGALYSDLSTKRGSGENVVSFSAKTKTTMPDFDVDEIISKVSNGMDGMNSVSLGSLAGTIEGDDFYFGICTTDEYYKVKLTYKYEEEGEKQNLEAYFVYTKDYKLVASKIDAEYKAGESVMTMEIKITPYSGKVATPKNPDSDEWKSSILDGLI